LKKRSSIERGDFQGLLSSLKKTEKSMSSVTFPFLRPKPTTDPAPPGDDTGEDRKPSRKHASVRPDRRRSRRRIVVGAVVLALGATVFAVTWSKGQSGREVLVLTRAVSAGQVISTDDLGQVRLPVDSGLRAVSAGELRGVVGQTAAYAEAPGTVLSAGMLGRSAVPAAGSALVALEVKQGQYPPDLAPGARVEVVPNQVTATVTGATASGDGSGGTVVTLQVPAAAAAQVAETSSPALVVLGLGGAQ
jgi:hypothetical protein